MVTCLILILIFVLQQFQVSEEGYAAAGSALHVPRSLTGVLSCTDFGLDQLAKSGTRLKSVLLYHVLPGGAYSVAQLKAATRANTVLGQDLNAAYPVQLSANATQGVCPPACACLSCCMQPLTGKPSVRMCGEAQGTLPSAEGQVAEGQLEALPYETSFLHTFGLACVASCALVACLVLGQAQGGRQNGRCQGGLGLSPRNDILLKRRWYVLGAAERGRALPQRHSKRAGQLRRVQLHRVPGRRCAAAGRQPGRHPPAERHHHWRCCTCSG